MKPPVIGITFSEKILAGDINNFINSEYARAIQAAGGIPKLIPNNSSKDTLKDIRETCDGLLISGGLDINPVLFGEEKHPKTGIWDDNRDRVELELVRWAFDTNWPILGICRGLQMLNVALNGTLFQDIPTQCNKPINHQAHELYPAHEIEIETGTEMSAIFKLKSMPVNSRHHQAVKDLSPELRVTARSSDGLIEGVEHPGRRFFIGVQWHPESLQEHEDHKRIFESFISAAGN